MPKVTGDTEKNKQLYRWAFTWWVESDEDRLKLVEWLKHNTKKWVFQQEQGGLSGNLHFQGRLSLINRKRKAELVAMAEQLNRIKPIHFSEEHEEESSQFYAMKSETRMAGPWTDKDELRFIPQEWRVMPVIEWHTPAMEELFRQDTRQIMIIVDPEGGIGKTVLTKKILMDGGISVPSTLETADKMMGCVYGQMDGRDPERRVTIVFDIPRATGKTRKFWEKLCEVLEAIKDGRAYDWRHNWKQCFFTSPRIIVFTNDAPPSDLLTGDRWVFHKPNQ